MPIQKKYICNLCSNNAEHNSGGELSEMRIVEWSGCDSMVLQGAESTSTSNVVLCGACIDMLRKFFSGEYRV